MKLLLKMLLLTSLSINLTKFMPIDVTNRVDTSEIITSKLLGSDFIGNEFACLSTLFGRDLLLTSDGGFNWITVPSNVVNGFGPVSFINRLQGWTAGSNGIIWKTTDGGKSWNMISKLESGNIKSTFASQIKFIDISCPFGGPSCVKSSDRLTSVAVQIFSTEDPNDDADSNRSLQS
jgi:hypothetical protein